MTATNDASLATACRLAYDRFEDFGIYALGQPGPGDPPRIVFVGSNDLADWLFNLRIFMDRSDVFGMSIHQGYHKLWTRMIPTFNHAFARVYQAGQPITFVGHSLGGALAMCAAVHLRTIRPAITADLVTFGSPRIFDNDGALDRRSFGRHYVYRFDPVPRLPLWRPWHRYGDPVEQVWLNRPLTALSEIVEPKGSSWHNLPGIGDHAIEKYEAALSGAVRG